MSGRDSWRLECADILEALAEAKFVRGDQRFFHDGPDGPIVSDTTLMRRGADTLHWVDGYVWRDHPGAAEVFNRARMGMTLRG